MTASARGDGNGEVGQRRVLREWFGQSTVSVVLLDNASVDD